MTQLFAKQETKAFNVKDMGILPDHMDDMDYFYEVIGENPKKLDYISVGSGDDGEDSYDAVMSAIKLARDFKKEVQVMIGDRVMILFYNKDKDVQDAYEKIKDEIEKE